LRHQWPHPAQLEAAQDPQADEAEVRVVVPPLPLLTKPQADISFLTFLLWQAGQSGLVLPMTRYSKSQSQLLQWYS
jgi:hypothetical protein